MKILLIMKNVQHGPTGVVVALRVKSLSDQVISLLEENREREAFELLKTRAIPLCFVPAGHMLEKHFPTLHECDLN